MGFDDEYVNMVKSGEEDDVFLAEEKPPYHYYGDIVRVLLISIGVLLLSMLFDRALLAFNIVIGIVLVLTITIFAGLTSPRNYGAILIDTVAAGFLFVVFEFFAVGAYYGQETVLNAVFILRQTIALAALFALYFSIKSLRGLLAESKDEEG